MSLSCASGYTIPAVVSAVSHSLEAGILLLKAAALTTTLQGKAPKGAKDDPLQHAYLEFDIFIM